VAAIKNG